MHCLDSFVVNSNTLVEPSYLYSTHENKNVAEFVCENDSQCIGIYDPGCDQKGPFKLVKNGLMISSVATDCMFKKKRYNGR